MLESVTLTLFHVDFCFQYLAASNREYVDLSAMALDLQKLYRQVNQNNDFFFQRHCSQFSGLSTDNGCCIRTISDYVVNAIAKQMLDIVIFAN